MTTMKRVTTDEMWWD